MTITIRLTYNIVHAVRELGVEPDVIRNDRITLDDVDRYDRIIVSPGPGIPSEAGILMPMLERYAASGNRYSVCVSVIRP